MKIINYDIGDVLSYTFKFIGKKFPSVALIFLIKITMLTTLVVMFGQRVIYIMNNFTSSTDTESFKMLFQFLFTGRIILFIILFILVELILQGYTIKLMQSDLFNLKLSTKEMLSYSLKKFGYLIGGSIALTVLIILLMIAAIIIMLILGLIFPLFAILGAIGFIVVLYIFLGYYRFMPYTAFINERLEGMMGETKELMTGHLGGSLLLLILLGLFEQLTNFITDTIIQSSVTVSSGIDPMYTFTSSMIGVLIVLVISTLVQYVAQIADIAYILIGKRSKKERRDRIRAKRLEESNKNAQDDLPLSGKSNPSSSGGYSSPNQIFKD
ncbi:hypothetical protein [Haloplasma contractile]|uniref:Uncharacterized protein n=1 Tax=Haloplasma contractile SSD-17B TaxID=1033810 RepID=U2DUH4_9MOLU|nr:hypothetical protein [Haloplasma contractile]ERJ12052.1 hypothetical protein HLPCO_001966 [Haloplasma contractile SSD-17B]